ncbi:hypothetical protein L1I79_13715 [Strepomyces sp. STD 3.1]|nr:hypothetical protein [Streptomyces sp. STD 3.1]
MASLQAQAGNRAVAEVVQRAGGADLLTGRARSNSAPADLRGAAASRELAEQEEQRRRVGAVSVEAAAAGRRRPEVAAERRRRVGAVAAEAAAEGRRREEVTEAHRQVGAEAAAAGRRRPEAAAERRRRTAARMNAVAAEHQRAQEAARRRQGTGTEVEPAPPEPVVEPAPPEPVVAETEQVVAPAEQVVAEEAPVTEEAQVAAEEERAAAEEEREAAEEQRGQEEVEQRRRGLRRRLAAIRAKLGQVNEKVDQLLGTEAKADKSKKVLDTPDTMATRVNAPTEAGVRTQAKATSDTGDMQTTAVMGQVGSGINFVTDALGVINDLRTLNTARKSRHDTGPASHKARKDMKGKPLGVASSGSMVVGDLSSMANAAVKNSGNLNGVTALGELTGGATVAFSMIAVLREIPAVWKTYTKKSRLKALDLEAPDAAPKAAGMLQDVLDQLGRAQARLGAATAEQAQGNEPEIDEFAAAVASLNSRLQAEIVELRQYARHKQHTKLAKRVANLGGNSVRTAAGGLAIAAAAGAVTGPAAPAVAGVAAAFLLGNGLYKGARAGSNRYVEARHPDRWARPTLAQDENEAERTEGAGAAGAQGVRRRDAVAEFFKVTKSVKQGERHHMAQKLYALAAGPDVRVGRDVPEDIRRSARALLVVLKAGPDQHHQSEEEWTASLNDPTQQGAWEKEITNQLSSA